MVILYETYINVNMNRYMILGYIINKIKQPIYCVLASETVEINNCYDILNKSILNGQVT